MEAPGYLIEKAMVNGITNGRGGKGSVFVYASGNGAAHEDQCNFDGYTNSIYSVTVAAVDHQGLHPYYSEACAANLVVAYSSGGGENIVSHSRNPCSIHSPSDRSRLISTTSVHLGTEVHPLQLPTPLVFSRSPWVSGRL